MEVSHIKEQYPSGNYYSVIPSLDDINHNNENKGEFVYGINLRKNFQMKLLNKYINYYNLSDFSENKESNKRYYIKNNWFNFSDAFFLHSFIKHFRPKRIIEAGSGYSTGVMLDTIDNIINYKPSFHAIEPNPERLNSLIKKKDLEYINLHKDKLQNIEISLFKKLKKGDLLFIDSSHVVKLGSDVKRIFFEILPIINKGVHVHFHDIFNDFEYPNDWTKEGRYWNEIYFLRSFLTNNNEWEITIFVDYVANVFSEFIETHMPMCGKGGSIYIKKK